MPEHFAQFLLITGEDWIEIPNAYTFITQTSDTGSVGNAIADGAFGDLLPMFEDTAYIPVGHVLLDARLFATGEDGVSHRFWIRTGPSA